MYYVTGGMSSNTAEVPRDNNLHVVRDVILLVRKDNALI